MRPDNPTLAALTEALEAHIKANEESCVLTSAIIVWEGMADDGWRMNYVSMPVTAAPSNSLGLLNYGIEEIRTLYKNGDAEDAEGNGE